MADNTTLNAGSAGDVVRDIDKGGVKTQVVTLDLGGAGAESLIAGTVPVTGTFWPATQPVSGTVTVSGTFWQATQPVSIAASVTVAQATASGLNATVVGTGTFATQASQAGTWTVQPGNTANTTPWLASIAQGGNTAIVTAASALKVDGSGVTQPVSIGSTVAVTQSGTWNVGTVTTVTTVAAVTAITNPLPAGTNLIGQVAAGQQVNQLLNGTTALTPKFAAISASASGATTIVAAVASKKIRVLRWSLSSNGAVNAKWQSHVTPTDLTGLHYLTQYASAGGAYCPVGIFETVAGEALDLNLSAAVAVGGELTYIEV